MEVEVLVIVIVDVPVVKVMEVIVYTEITPNASRRVAPTGAAVSKGAGHGGASAGVPGVGRTGGNGTRGTCATGGTGSVGLVGASAIVPGVGGTGGADIGGATRGSGFGGASRLGGGAGGASSWGAVPTEARGSGGSQPQLLPGSPLLAPAPHTAVTESFIERGEPASRPITPVRSRRGVRPCPPPVPSTHIMALRPSSVPQRVVLPSPPTSSLPHIPDPESDLVRAASLAVTHLLATVVTEPCCESTAASALVAELIEFADFCRLQYAASLVF
ncbi:unnamed protein product [Closterium sp. NIES-54]